MTINEFKIQEALGVLTHSKRIKIALDPKTSKHILFLLSQGPAAWAVCQNENVNTKILDHVALHSEYKGARWYAVDNAKTSMYVLKYIGKHDDHGAIRGHARYLYRKRRAAGER